MIECIRTARTKPNLAILCMQYGVSEEARKLKAAGVPVVVWARISMTRTHSLELVAARSGRPANPSCDRALHSPL